MGFNEFVLIADIPADMPGPQGAGAAPSTQPVLHPSQRSICTHPSTPCRSYLAESAAQQANSGRDSNNDGHDNVAYQAPVAGPAGQHLKSKCRLRIKEMECGA